MKTRDSNLIFISVVLLLFGLLCLQAIASEHPLKVWAANKGNSMVPQFPEKCFVEIELGVPFASLKQGQVVVFWDYVNGNQFVCHRLVSKRGSGWVTKGDNNSSYDPTWVTPTNYIAVATGRYARFLVIE